MKQSKYARMPTETPRSYLHKRSDRNPYATMFARPQSSFDGSIKLTPTRYGRKCTRRPAGKLEGGKTYRAESEIPVAEASGGWPGSSGTSCDSVHPGNNILP